jgi:molybdenum cofactor cytidylyltransferase
MKLGVILLAAGASSRMGRPKLLLPWGATTLLGHLLQQWRGQDAAQIAVVHAESNQPLRRELDRLEFPTPQRILNPQPERGMFSSIQCAANWPGWQADLTHWAIVLGDQPLVRDATLRELIAFARSHPDAVCQPARNGRGRHPVILPADVFAELKTSAVGNLKQFLLARGAKTERCESDDPGLDLDLDEPADYERALALARSP